MIFARLAEHRKITGAQIFALGRVIKREAGLAHEVELQNGNVGFVEFRAIVIPRMIHNQARSPGDKSLAFGAKIVAQKIVDRAYVRSYEKARLGAKAF